MSSVPTRDDSGYFEFGINEEDDQDLNDGAIMTRSTQHVLRRANSISSIHSHISRGSSQLWEGLSAPDEDMLIAVDDTVLLHQSLQETRPNDQSGAPAADNNEGYHHEVVSSERRLSETEGPHASRNRCQRPRDELDISDTLTPMAIDAIVVAHSDRHQILFDRYKLPWGVQWEIARLVSRGRLSYADILLDNLKELEGRSNAIGGPMVEELLLGKEGDKRRRQLYNEAFAKELSIKTPWAELDKEEENLARDPLCGLGSSSLQDDWYGGKVSFVAKLCQKEQASRYKSAPGYFLELEAPELGPSTRITRRWGSRRFLRVRIPETILYHDNKLLDYFSRPIVIHGKVFRPFYAKESGVFLLEVNQKFLWNKLKPDPNNGKLSLDEFLEWHNPMDTNKKQSLAKWCARMALGLSNSVPGIEFAAEDIMEIDDIYTPAGQAAMAAGRKPDSKDVTTDGCGFTNQKTLVDGKYRYNWDLVPAAVQFRNGGTKGLLLRHPDDNGLIDGPPKMWTRPSQSKISYPSDAPRDRAHLVLDLLRRSHLKYPSRLSTEIIVNLAENGVSYDIFERLMMDGLEAIAASLTQWSGPYAMQNLWAAVARQGSIIRARMSREAAGSSRALGFGSRDKEEGEEDEDEEAIDIPARSKAWWADEISGCPSTLEETVLVLLDAGFEPQSCHILAAKLKEVLKKALNSYIDRYKIEIPCSAEAWIVPDPCGVLEPGEIFLRTSEQIVGQDGFKTDHLLGDVLVTRHPCRVPSDVQKVRAVWKDELRGYYDVIIFSVKGERSLASMLGGGDYDGDTGHVIWDSAIVTAFKNADNKFADPPPDLEDAFEKNTMTVGDFLEKYRGSYDAMAAERQNYLLGALRNGFLIGSYGNWHDVAVYKFGYHSEEAWRLAYMFCAVLDSSKTGKTVKPERLRKDKATYKGIRPDWKASINEENNISAPPPDQDRLARRQGRLTKISFIMDQLKTAARKQYNYHLSCFEKLHEGARRKFKAQNFIKTPHLYVDPALEAPWNNAVERAEKLAQKYNQNRMKDELNIIRQHVKAVCERHCELVRQDAKGRQRSGHQPLSPRKEGSTFTDKPIEQRQNILREISLEFCDMPQDFEFDTLSPEDVRRYRASYAYILETERHEKKFHNSSSFARFPFDVAMRELGIIKAASIGPCNMVSSRFYSVFSVVGAIKAFRPADGQAYTY